MATRITNSDQGWRIRMIDAEYDLSLPELGEWILDGRVSTTQDVRPPTTKRWEHAQNCIELQPFFGEKARRDLQARWDADVPQRAALAARTAKAKKMFSGVGLSMAILGLLILFTGTTLGIVCGIGLGAIGAIVFFIGQALQ